MKVVTCIAPVNIAVIKYWGKRDEDLILPINDSISATLCLENMCAKTTIMASSDFTENRFWLNGKEETFDNVRLQNCLTEIKIRAAKITDNATILNWPIHICSVNDFPTAAGLASSAAGYACLVAALATLYNVNGDVSAIARRGSGSACRSVYGGWVQWHAGTAADGSDSIARPLHPAAHWPEMRVLVLVVNDARKSYSSTTAMRAGVATSALLAHRASALVPRHVTEMRAALAARDMERFARVTMADSNQFHAVCLDTFPPCVYLSDVSHAVVRMVHAYNAYCGGNKVAYTFDAGPNACLYLLHSHIPEVVALINAVFPPNLTIDITNYFRGTPLEGKPHVLSQELRKIADNLKQQNGSLKYVIVTKVGEGPKVIQNEDLLDKNGLPKE